MPAPTQATYSVSATATFATGFLALVDANPAPAHINIKSAADVLLIKVQLTDPAGSVNGTTGQLTLTPAGTGLAVWAGGRAAYGEVCDGAGNVLLALPTIAGVAPVPGYLVLNALDLLSGAPLTLTSVLVG